MLSYLLALPLVVSTVAAAQEKINIANAEDIAIAFYKTGNIVPNFKNWVTEREPYSLTPFARRAKVMESELLRLNTAYQSFNPKKHLLSIRTAVHLNTNIIQNTEGEDIYNLTLQLDKSNDVFYLPYKFLDQNFMLIPQKLQSLKARTISKVEYERIKSLPSIKDGYPLIINLKPKKADFKHPYDVDGLAQWAFTTDIASMEVWDTKGGLIWEYTAPWYISPYQQKIKSLYNGDVNNKSSNDSIKNIPNWE